MSGMAGSAVCIFLYHSHTQGAPQAARPVAATGILLPSAAGLVGLPHLRAAQPAPHPTPAPAPPPRRSGPSPAPAAASAPPTRTPAEAPSSAQLRAELQRWPDAKCKCKLLWKPRQGRVPNPELDGAWGAAGSAPRIPAPGRPRAQAPARGRLEVLLRPQHPAPEMPGMQIGQNLFSLCIA